MSVTALSREDAAIVIQKHWRGRLERLNKEKLQAIIAIQNFWRSYLAQRKVEECLLPRPLFEKAVAFVDKLSSLPKACHGNTPVYYARGIPVVIKQCGSSKTIEQLAEMNLARQVCLEKGFKHVVVPRGRTMGDFLFAEKIFYSSRTKVQVGFYMNHYSLFAQAIQEFSILYFSTTIPDLVDLDSKYHNFYKSLCEPSLKYPFCRYDNLALYITKGVGKIGLVDLQGFTPVASHSSALYLQKCQHLVGMFPKHLDEIFEIATQFDKEIEKNKKKLSEQQAETLDCFDKIYTVHLQFVQRAKIRLDDPAKFDQFSFVVLEKLRSYLNDHLQNVHQYEKPPYKNCLGEDPDATLERFQAKAFLSITLATHTFIATALKEQAQQHLIVSSYEELLGIRTLIFNLSKEVWKIKKMTDLLSMFSIPEENRINLLRGIVFFLLNCLAELKVVAYYNSEFGFPPNQAHCLFC